MNDHAINNAGKIIASAVQLEAVTGDVSANLERVEELSRKAILQGAKLIALPEFFTSRVAFCEEAFHAVLPPDNEAVDLLRLLAAKHECWIGGSMLIADEGDVYNRYHFVEPDGTIHLHDKDLPTMWENTLYAPGNDSGAFKTNLGGVGAAVCWELIRTQTAKRLLGKVDIVMTGTHWWTVAYNWGKLARKAIAASEQYNRYLSENAPAELARRIGVPVLQASHCGNFTSGYMLVPGLSVSLPYETEFVGCTQIVNAYGHVMAYRQAQEGPGIVTAEVSLGSVEPLIPLDNRFWLPNLTPVMKQMWYQQNACGKSFYKRKGRSLGLKNAKAVAAQRAEGKD